MAAAPFLSLVMGGLQAVAAISAGKAQKAQYDIQAQQAELEGDQNALNYNRQATNLLMESRQMAGTIAAKGAAGGVDITSGSAMDVNRYNAYRFGEDINIRKEDAEMAIASGLAKSQSLQAAGKIAMKSAYMNAFGAIAGGLSNYSALKTS